MNEVFLAAAAHFERWRVEHPALYAELAEAAGSAEQARALYIEMYVDAYDKGVAKERARCIAICDLARGAGKPGMTLARELIESGMAVEEAFERLLVVSEDGAVTSLAYRAITRAPEFA
jgi:hypothetical protein